MRFPAKSNLELHLDFQYLLIELFTLVCLWWGRSGVPSHDYQNFSDGYIAKGQEPCKGKKPHSPIPGMGYASARVALRSYSFS